MSTTSNIATAGASVLASKEIETIRPVHAIEKDFSISEDGRLSLNKGAKTTPSEFALFIADRENTGSRFKTQARWAYYSAGQLQNGTEVQAEIAKRLKEMLSASAFHQLKSEASTICPLVIAEGLKTPLSVLKDAMGELKVAANGKLAPLKDQTKAAKELIPMLKAGTVTQAKVREVRAKHKAPTTPSGNANKGDKGDKSATADAVAFGVALGKLKSVQEYVGANKIEGDDNKQLVTILTDIARQLGVQVIVPGAK